MFRLTSAVACAVAVAGSALVGLTTGTANAAPGCPDVHWMGAAGSGERTEYEVVQNEGMGAIVYQSYQALAQQLAQEGRTITAEAVNYPAKDVPADAGVGDWLDYMGSVDVGTAALGGQYAEFTARCPESKVVLAGYSQGAMVVHRNLASDRSQSEPGRRAADRRRRSAPRGHHGQHRHRIDGSGEDRRRRAGLADPGTCARAPAREHRRPDHQRLRRRRRGV